MRTIFIFLTFILGSLVSLGQLFADVIPEDSHGVNRCVKFSSDISKFPDVVLIGKISGPMSAPSCTEGVKNCHDGGIIEADKCIEKGYKLNTYGIYAVKKSYLDSQGGWQQLDPSLINLSDITNPFGGYVSNSNPLVEEEIIYSIGGYEDGNVVVYKSKHTMKFNDGSADKIQTFDPPANLKESL